MKIYRLTVVILLLNENEKYDRRTGIEYIDMGLK